MRLNHDPVCAEVTRPARTGHLSDAAVEDPGFAAVGRRIDGEYRVAAQIVGTIQVL
jgi:hypothetical protein